MSNITNQITVKVGGEASGWRSTAQAMGKDMNQLSEQFGKMAFSGMGFATVGNYMKAVVGYARDLKGELNENERAAKNFATSLDGIQESGLRIGANVLGWINRVAAAGTEGYLRQLNAVGLLSDATIRNMEISEMAEANAQKLAEWKETEGRQHKALNEEIAKSEERIAAAKMAALNTETQTVLLMGQVRDLEEKLAAAGENTLAGKKIKVELMQKEAELVKLNAKLEDEGVKIAEKAASDRAKADAEKIKAAEDYAKAIALSVEEETELGRLMLLARQNADTMTKAEKDRLEVLKSKKAIKENEVKIEELLKKGVQNLTDEELKQLDALAKANGVIERRITSLQPQLIANAGQELQVTQQLYSLTKAIADEEDRRLNAIEQSRRVKAATIGSAGSSLSNYELRSQIKSIASELQRAREENPSGSITGNLTGAEYVLYSNMKALEGELRNRENRENSEESAKIYDAVIEKGGSIAEALQAANFPEFYEQQRRREEARLAFDERIASTASAQADQIAKTGTATNTLLASMNENLRVIRTQLGNGGLDEARKY